MLILTSTTPSCVTLYHKMEGERRNGRREEKRSRRARKERETRGKKEAKRGEREKRGG